MIRFCLIGAGASILGAIASIYAQAGGAVGVFMVLGFGCAICAGIAHVLQEEAK